MADVKRICSNCKSNRTLVNEGIYEVRDFRGHTFALIGTCCQDEINALKERLFVKYGGFTQNGVHLASCYGSPTIRDIEHLREEVSK